MKLIEQTETRLQFKQSGWWARLIGVAFIAATVYMYLQPFPDQQWWFAPIFGIAGLAALLLGATVSTAVDKGTQTIVVTNARLIGKKEVTSHWNEVKKVVIQETIKREKGTTMRGYELLIEKQDGQLMSVAQTGAGNTGALRRQNKIAKQGKLIADMIGVELENRGAASMGDIMSAIKKGIQSKNDEN